ncbi:MBL fold metallo-hydrolase [Paenibacillus xylaniclasticus]|uniref:MBL fold metallo-hydrolase n=1 Tax=Paenibacillus xylaniclasticus TaxID=588083 RepID=UPI000FD8958B|nr:MULTISPECIES: MBL fold metallo-hydrolase [Paenibacillus]GFN31765.1 MBL fold metallo-hydrolase [Paenibacillus curdlanolyticus]
MKITSFGKVHQLSFMPSLFPVNCYLVEEDNELTLIDCALPYSAKGIMNTAAAIGKPITHIALTHAHGDHIGALDELKRQLPEAKVSISARDARLLRGDRSLDQHEHQQPIRGGVPKPGAIQTVPDLLLSEGDRVGSFEVIVSPGHTPGSISFWEPNSRILIAGDAFSLRGGTAVSGKVVPLFPFPAMATWSKEQAVMSAERLLQLEPAVLAVGHGSMLHHPQQSMSRAIAQARQALQA